MKHSIFIISLIIIFILGFGILHSEFNVSQEDKIYLGPIQENTHPDIFRITGESIQLQKVINETNKLN